VRPTSCLCTGCNGSRPSGASVVRPQRALGERAARRSLRVGSVALRVPRARPRRCELGGSQRRHDFCGVLDERAAILARPHDDELVDAGGQKCFDDSLEPVRVGPGV
jgi:hypothetical protein